MRQLQLLLAKVTLKCSYYFVCLLPEVRLSCWSLQEFSLSCFHVSCHSRSIVPVSPTTAATIYWKPNNSAKKMRLKSEFIFLHYLYLATKFLHLVTLISITVAKRWLGIFFNFEPRDSNVKLPCVCCSSILTLGTKFSEPVQNFWTGTNFLNQYQIFWTSTNLSTYVSFFFF